MLYNQNLEELIFNRHQVVQSDELMILSGYVGPNPISRLQSLPLKTTVIYGMYGSEGIRPRLHSSLISLQGSLENVDIYYSNTPVHSKCYVWRNNRNVTHALIGSANFSTNGLSTPFREVLAETTTDTFLPLNDYITIILNNSILCLDADIDDRRRLLPTPEPEEIEYCRMTLLDPRTGEVQNASGLNWGQSAGNVNPNDACIPIRIDHIRMFPELFPPKQTLPTAVNGRGRTQRHNDSIEIIWDDGTTMEGLLEGSQPVGRVRYPKQLASFPNKDIFGLYIRQRIGVPADGSRITREHLERYGRTDIDVSLQAEGVYFLDFSTSN